MQHHVLCIFRGSSEAVYCHRPKKPKKKKQKVKEDPAAKISGPSNAHEAQLMRSVLGFAPASPSPAAVPVALTSGLAAAPPQAQPQLQAVQAVAVQPAPQQAQRAAANQQVQQATAPQQAQQKAAPQQTPATQQAQAAPIQPQQQSTFRFGFAAERPTEATPLAEASQTAAPAVAQELSQAAAQQALPGPPAAAAEPGTDFVARRVFVGGMPFTYEVRHQTPPPPSLHLPPPPQLASSSSCKSSAELTYAHPICDWLRPAVTPTPQR